LKAKIEKKNLNHGSQNYNLTHIFTLKLNELLVLIFIIYSVEIDNISASD